MGRPREEGEPARRAGGSFVTVPRDWEFASVPGSWGSLLLMACGYKGHLLETQEDPSGSHAELVEPRAPWWDPPQ